MDSNSLPMVPDLDVFPRVVRYVVLGVLLLFVAAFFGAVLVGVLTT